MKCVPPTSSRVVRGEMGMMSPAAVAKRNVFVVVIILYFSSVAVDTG